MLIGWWFKKMIRRRTITSYVWNSVSGNKMVILSNCIRNFFRKFELIGNSMQGENPAPDNPQEIKSAGRKSKNLLNLQKQPDVKETYLGWKVSDGRNVVLSVKDKGNNADITGCYLGLSRTGGSSDGVVWVVNNGSVAVKEVVSKNQYVSVFPSNETTVRKLLERFDIQVEYGGNATDYEPYGYFLDVKVTGKNLLDKSIILPLSSYDIKDGIYWRKYFYLLPNTDYLIRVTPHYTEKLVDTSGFLGVGEPYDNNLPNGIISLIPDVGTTDKTNYFRTDATGKVILKFKDSANEENIRKMLEQVEITLALKTFNNEHEPYTEQSMQIVLNEPLRGIGEYKDVLTKDGVVRKIKRIVFDGSEDEEWRLDRKLGNHINFALVIKGAITVNTGIRTMMDKFKYLRAVWNNNLPGQDMFGAKLRINMPKTLATDLQTFKTWLSQNPLTVDYVLAEPVTEPLPESVQAQLQALHTENGITHVFVDSGEVECGINIEYKYKS